MSPATRLRRNRLILAGLTVFAAAWTCAAVLIPALTPP